MQAILDSLKLNRNNLLLDLNKLNELIRNDESLRQQTPELFYSILNEILSQHLDKKQANVSNEIIELAVKCLKNSSAAIKTNLGEDETRICKLLIEYLNDSSRAQHQENICIFIMQYFFNLSQGNEKALDLFLDEFILICSNMLNRETTSIRFDFINLASMILMNICTKKLTRVNQMTLLNSFETYTRLINRIFEHEQLDLDKEEEIDLNMNWPFKLINHLFDKFYLAENFYFDFNQLNLEQRINMLKLVKYKLSSDLKSYSNFKCLDYLIKQFDISTSDLVDLTLNEIETDTLKQVSDYLNEIKLIAHCISDLLVNDLDNNSFIDYAQNNNSLFKNVCDLFKLIHENDLVKRVLDLSKSTSGNLKIELIRLIGILVHSNLVNQNLLVDYKILHLISNNLNIDMDNLFVREWSIIALKHILDKLDLK